jgi:hypothetical protein
MSETDILLPLVAPGTKFKWGGEVVEALRHRKPHPKHDGPSDHFVEVRRSVGVANIRGTQTTRVRVVPPKKSRIRVIKPDPVSG